MHISSNGHSNHGALLTGRLAHQDVCKSPNVILICWASCSSWAGPAAHHSFRLWSQSCWLYSACMRCPWARLQLDKSCLRYLLSKRQQMAAYAVSAEPACTTRHSTEAMAHNGCPARLDDIATLLMLICRLQDGAQIYAVDCTTINRTTGKSIYVEHTRLRKALVANGVAHFSEAPALEFVANSSWRSRDARIIAPSGRPICQVRKESTFNFSYGGRDFR